MSLLAGVVAIALVSFGPLREQLQYATAKAAIADRDWPRAIKILERLQQKTGPTARQQFLLGCVHRRQGEFRDGETCFERAESLGWEKVEIRRQRLLTVAQAGDIKDVEQELIRLLDSGGDDLLAEEIYEAMAKGYLNSFRMPDADRCLKFWADWQKNNPVQHFLKGTLEEIRATSSSSQRIHRGDCNRPGSVRADGALLNSNSTPLFCKMHPRVFCVVV